jgi:hypothetical protein
MDHLSYEQTRKDLCPPHDFADKRDGTDFHQPEGEWIHVPLPGTPQLGLRGENYPPQFNPRHDPL